MAPQSCLPDGSLFTPRPQRGISNHEDREAASLTSLCLDITRWTSWAGRMSVRGSPEPAARSVWYLLAEGPVADQGLALWVPGHRTFGAQRTGGVWHRHDGRAVLENQTHSPQNQTQQPVMCIFLSQTQWYGSRCPLRACSPGVSNQLSGHGWACTLLGAPKPVWSCCPMGRRCCSLSAARLALGGHSAVKHTHSKGLTSLMAAIPTTSQMCI